MFISRILLGLALVVVGGWRANSLSAAEPTPAQQKIVAAHAGLQKSPENWQLHAALGMALAERARETGNPDFYEEGAKAVDKSLEIKPDNFAALKTRAWILLGQHEFPTALELCHQLTTRIPDDPMVFGMLTDAHVELGNYDEAEEACQHLLDMRPDEVLALARGSYLRELMGDIDGAIDLMQMAYERTPPTEREYQAWALTQLAHLAQATGKLDLANMWLEKGAALMPDYHYVVAAQAELFADQRKYDESLARWQKLYEIAPHPENLYRIGCALRRCNRPDEAKKAFEQFEAAALGESENWDNANRELVSYYTEEGANPAAALKVARLEFDRRKDVHTLEIYAWALYANQQFDLARQQIDKGLAIGIRDVRMFYRAGMIAVGQADLDSARKFFGQALETNGSSEWGERAREELGGITK